MAKKKNQGSLLEMENAVLRGSLISLQNKYEILANTRISPPLMLDKPKCKHGQEMDLVSPRSCGFCVQNPEALARVELERAKEGYEKLLTDANDEIRRLKVIVEYLEDKSGSCS